MKALAKHLEPHRSAVVATDRSGPEQVDVAREAAFAPAPHAPLVRAFKEGVLDRPAPAPERGAREAAPEVGVSKGKKVYRADGPGGKPARFLVRPYFERAPTGLAHMAGRRPLAGWAEMTFQHLAHAGGLGHVTQRSHVVRGDTATPLLVTHLEPFHGSPADLGGQDLQKRRTPERDEDARRGVLLDFLSGNPDRHAGNLLVGPEGNHLMIDHALAFRYHRPNDHLGRRASPAHDTVWPYHADAVWDLLHPAGGRWEDARADRQARAEQDYRPTLDWWTKVREPMHRAMEERAKLLRDPAERARVLQNFRERALVLDDAAAGRAPLLTRHARMI